MNSEMAYWRKLVVNSHNRNHTEILHYIGRTLETFRYRESQTDNPKLVPKLNEIANFTRFQQNFPC